MEKKFRVWSYTTKSWFHNVFEKEQIFGAMGRHERGVYFAEIHQNQDHPEYVIEQWSGLKDIHNREIYENDIVEYLTTEDELARAIVRLGTPTIHTEVDDGSMYLTGFYLDHIKTYKDDELTDEKYESLDELGGDFLVVGNIHDGVKQQNE